MIPHLFFYQLAVLGLLVAYLRYADKYFGPCASRLREVYQPVLILETGFQDPVYTSWHVSERTEPLHTPIFNRHPTLDRLCLGPRRHAVEQHLFERPHVIGQSHYHRRGTRSPQLR